MVLNTQAGTACHRSGWQVASTTQSIWTVSGGLVGPQEKIRDYYQREEQGNKNWKKWQKPTTPAQAWWCRDVDLQSCNAVLGPKKSHLYLWGYSRGMDSVITYAKNHLPALSLHLPELCRNSPQISPKWRVILWGLAAHCASWNHPIPSFSLLRSLYLLLHH